MRHILLLTALAASFTLCAQAQTKTGTIEGTITDGRQKTVESATIALLRAQDSTTIKYAVADKSGRFQFEALPSGGYLVLVSAVGHGKTYSEKAILSDEKTHIVLPALLLQPMAKDMAAVVVTSRKPFIEQKIDRTVVNVDASVTNAGATALEVLEKSPGVSVDKDGNISLKGKQGVTVMMDGRPAYLSGAELSNYLRSLPASALDQIEIMTNPSSKYDASGNSGIINIKVKKNKQKGFNGNLSATYGQGRYWRSNGSLNLNYRTGKVNLFMNANTGMWSGFQRLDIHRKFRSGETGNLTAIFDQTSHMLRRNDFHSLKLGADVYLTSRTTVGFVTSGFINPENTTSRNVIRLMDADGKVDSVDHAYTRNEQRWKNGTFNLNFRHQFDSTGRELTADVDYIRFDSERDQIFNNITRNNSETKLRESSLRGDLPVSILIRSAKMDYTQTVAKDFKFEAGLKTSFVETDNNAGYFQVYGNREEVDYTKTNQFVYTENINAAYLNLNRQFKKFGVQAGLRYEYTRYKGHQFGNPDKGDSLFSRNYGNLFPTMFLSYTADKNNQFGLSFGRRIDRPAYQDLNPFLFFLDNYTYEQGNPFLKPQFTNNFELSHTWKSMVTTTLNYNITRDLRAETFEQSVSIDDTTKYATIVRRGNIGKRNAAGLAVSAQVPVQKWWTAIIYTNLNYTKFGGRINGREEINIDATNLMININNQFKFNKGWGAEISGWYRTKGIEGQILIQPMGQMSAGLSKQVMKGKGSLKLNIRDIFYTQNPRGSMTFQGTEARFENSRDSRTASLTFTYRFGKPIKGQQQRRKIGGADEETNRVKVGNGN